MPIAHYLAMTSAEMTGNSVFPDHTAWMACHFSPSGQGLSNLPKWLPPGSVLILDDSTPIHDHDPVLIAEQLQGCIKSLQCVGLLLDFQRPGEARTQELTDYLCRTLPCSVTVSELYADAPGCAVFMAPIAADESMDSRLARWSGREIWLDTTLEGMEIALTERGAVSAPLPSWEHPDNGFPEERLHCHYQISLDTDRAVFTLWRTSEDIAQQLEEAEQLGVTAAVGLYQEFQRPLPSPEEGVE